MAMSARGEFGFIEYIKEHFKVSGRMVGIGDDCAIMPCGAGELIYSTDMLMEGVHFLRDAASPEDIGWKSLAVNLSDIAAMGGTPTATFLSVALPKDVQGEWAERFIEGYAELSKKFNVPLLGGDTTSSLRDIAINVGVLGRAPLGKSVKRSGASVGHGIYVTGSLGDSAGGLQAILNNWDKTQEVDSLIESHIKPMPRIEEGQVLMNTELIGAMMDISDGIASDLRHILNASGVGAEVHLDRIPMSDNLKWACEKYGKNAYALAVGGGEDYELLFTAPVGIEDLVDFPIYKIGEIVPGNSFIWLENDNAVDFDVQGFNHF
jgi:thiamine-monophosphate kinase